MATEYSQSPISLMICADPQQPDSSDSSGSAGCTRRCASALRPRVQAHSRLDQLNGGVRDRHDALGAFAQNLDRGKRDRP